MKATALPTEPQPLPRMQVFTNKLVVDVISKSVTFNGLSMTPHLMVDLEHRQYKGSFTLLRFPLVSAADRSVSAER